MISSKPGEAVAIDEAAEKSKPGEMTTLTSILEKLRIKKQDKEWKMTPRGLQQAQEHFTLPIN